MVTQAERDRAREQGRRIRERRRALGLTVAELARATGVAASTVYDLERGDIGGLSKMHRLAAVLGVSVAYLEAGGDSSPLAPAAGNAAGMSPEALAVAREWDRLEEPARSQIRKAIRAFLPSAPRK